MYSDGWTITVLFILKLKNKEDAKKSLSILEEKKE